MWGWSCLFVLTLVASLAALLGGWLAVSVSPAGERMQELTAVGAGFLLGGALFGLVPGAVRVAAAGYLFVAAGYFGMYLFRVFAGGHGSGRSVAGAAFAGLAFHSAVDGAALGSALHHGGPLALTAFVAVFLHKLPEGFSVAALTCAGGGSRRLGLAAAGGIGLATLLGAALPLLWLQLSPGSNAGLLGAAAGSFLYVGATDVLPGLMGRHGPGRIRLAGLVLVGAAVVLVLTRAAAGGHGH